MSKRSLYAGSQIMDKVANNVIQKSERNEEPISIAIHAEANF